MAIRKQYRSMQGKIIDLEKLQLELEANSQQPTN